MGKIQTRSMFGGYGVFLDNVMFALLINEKVYFRFDDPKISEPQVSQDQRYCYYKGKHNVKTNYYTHNEFNQLDVNLLKYSNQALARTRQRLSDELEKKKPTLKELPNLTATYRRMLNEVGVDSVLSLHHHGAVSVFRKLRERYTTLTEQSLYCLHGAITGRHWAVLSTQERQQLRFELNEPSKNT
ncbi:TfoX/Sxy family DNA transformation protein [Vibrio sp. F13]|uniref:TfoX/Sxy family DNA transformation protein n=1 Tax=Vibrio sp. F13 TaxID=2070777 RepID=UPI001485841E|nr:TfoX/Sxy family DNA transformation protein [Vibrio sp. F13]